MSTSLASSVVQEILEAFQSAKEKKLALLLKYVDAGIEAKHPFVVEAVFHHYFGVKLSIAEIRHLRDLISPLHAVQDFVSGRNFLVLDQDTGIVAFRKAYRVKLREVVFFAAFMVGYLGTTGSVIFLVASMVTGQSSSVLLSTAVILGSSVLIWWFSIVGAQALVAARRSILHKTRRAVATVPTDQTGVSTPNASADGKPDELQGCDLA